MIQSVKNNPNDANAIPGIAGLLALEITAGTGPDQPDTGLGAITGLFEFTGRVQVMFNTTLEEQVFQVPEAFRNVLPDDYPTEIKIFESAPSIDGTTEEDPTSDGGIYLSALIAGSVKLFDVITLAGFFSITREVAANGLPSYIRVAGAVAMEIASVGSLSGSLDLGFYGDYNGQGPVAIGRATLALHAGGAIPGLKFDAQALLEFNTLGQAIQTQTFMTKLDAGERTAADYDAYALALDPTTNLIRIGKISIATGLRLIISGRAQIGPLELNGRFLLDLRASSLRLAVFAQLKVGPLGQASVTGDMTFSSAGVVIFANVSLAASFGGDIGLSFSASAELELNTTGANAQFVDLGGVTRTLAPGFRLTIRGEVNFLGLRQGQRHDLGRAAERQLRALLRRHDLARSRDGEGARLRRHLRPDANGQHGGIVLRLAISLDLNVIEIIKIKGSGELRLNTTDITRNAGGVNIGARSFRIQVTGELRLLEVIKMNASFTLQVGGGPVNVGVGDSFTASTLNLLPGEWVIEVSASMDFFGLATLSARGWIASNGLFALRLQGELVLGSRSFGLVGDFNFGIKLTRDINPACTGQTGQAYENCIRNNPGQYRFEVVFSANVDVKVFGISLAGVGIGGSLSATGDGGEIDLVATIRVRITILFITVTKTAEFRIGTIQLPKPVYLAGGASNTKVFVSGDLHLNMGSRAGDRGVSVSVINESFTVEHVDGAAGNETVRVKAFGREQIFYGVARVVANAGTGNDYVITGDGLLAAVLLNGDGGDDVIIHNGRGAGTINGGGEDDYIETAAGVGALTIDGGAGADFIVHFGTVGATLNGGLGDDRIVGGPGADTISGGDDSDLLEGGGGDDAISGGNGNDTIRMGMPTGISARMIDGGAGTDTIELTGTGDGDSLMVMDPAGASVDARFSTMNGTTETGAKQASSVEALAIDLGRGGDRVTIGPMTDSTIRSVRVDTGRTIVNTGQFTFELQDGVLVRVPVFSNAPDNAADTVTVLGGAGADTFMLTGSGDLQVAHSGGATVTVVNARRAEGDALIVDGAGENDLLDASRARRQRAADAARLRRQRPPDRLRARRHDRRRHGL